MDVTKSERFEQLDRLLTEHDGMLPVSYTHLPTGSESAEAPMMQSSSASLT